MSAARDITRDAAPDPDGAVEIVATELLHRGQRLRLERVTERHPDGTTHTREIIRHPGAVVILPVLDDGRIVVIEQHRTALGAEILELPAGTLEADEDPLAAAQRELAEETGYRAGTWTPLLDFHPAPGLTDERMQVLLATGLEPGERQLDAGERIRVRELPVEELRQRLVDNTIVDGKTLVALLYVMFLGIESENRQLP